MDVMCSAGAPSTICPSEPDAPPPGGGLMGRDERKQAPAEHSSGSSGSPSDRLTARVNTAEMKLCFGSVALRAGEVRPAQHEVLAACS